MPVQHVGRAISAANSSDCSSPGSGACYLGTRKELCLHHCAASCVTHLRSLGNLMGGARGGGAVLVIGQVRI
jgi:hypothetical protein